MLPAGFSGIGSDDRCSRRPTRRHPPQRPHQPRRDRQDIPIEAVRRVLAETDKASERERDLPAHVMVYYAIALSLYMSASTREVLRCLLEGLRWLWGAEAVRVAGKSGISQARSRL